MHDERNIPLLPAQPHQYWVKCYNCIQGPFRSLEPSRMSSGFRPPNRFSGFMVPQGFKFFLQSLVSNPRRVRALKAYYAQPSAFFPDDLPKRHFPVRRNATQSSNNPIQNLVRFVDQRGFIPSGIFTYDDLARCIRLAGWRTQAAGIGASREIDRTWDEMRWSTDRLVMSEQMLDLIKSEVCAVRRKIFGSPDPPFTDYEEATLWLEREGKKSCSNVNVIGCITTMFLRRHFAGTTKT